ncbi:hypothetical protein SOVF_166650 [Spinacia oleracea]|nr:hypothetical protein SOVF_166650 [Spinacia oleracea]
MDLAQALKLDPRNGEFQQKLKEVISLLGWSPNFVGDALEVVREDDLFKNYAHNGKEEEENRKKGKEGEGEGKERDRSVLGCRGAKNSTKMEKNVVDKGPNVNQNNSVLKSTSETKNSNLTGSRFRFSNRKRHETFLDLTPSMYGVISSGRTLHYYGNSLDSMISIRVLDPSKRMDCSETREVDTQLEISHPPVEGQDRCEATPHMAQEDRATSMATVAPSYEATPKILPNASVLSPLQSIIRSAAYSSKEMKKSVSSHRSMIRRKCGTLKSRSPSDFTNSWFCRKRVGVTPRPLIHLLRNT